MRVVGLALVAVATAGFLACSHIEAARAGVVVTAPDPSSVLYQFASDPETAIRETRERIAAGKMAEAIHYLEGYVAAHPLDVGPRRFLGDLYFRTGQLDRAKFVYGELLRMLPNDKETHNRLGTVLAVQNHVDEAIAQFEASLPGTDSVNDLIALHERKGDLPKYRQTIERLGRDYPTDAPIQAEVGQFYNAVHQPYLASVYFKRALDNDATNLTALNGLGLALLSLHDRNGSIDAFRACLRIEARAYVCRLNLGAAQLEAGQLDDAKTSLDMAHGIAPERGETYVNYGYLADARGDWEKAVSYYAQSISIDPYLREAYIDLGIAYEDRKLYRLAQAALIKGLASVNDDGRLHYLLGMAYDAQGDRANAAAQFKLAASGSDPDAARIAQDRFSAFGATATMKPEQR